MQILEYFKTPIWIEEKPEFIKSLNKASDPYIKEASKRNKDYIKKNGDFGISHHSTPLTVDTKFKDFHNYVGQKCWEFLDWQGFDMSQYQTFFEQKLGPRVCKKWWRTSLCAHSLEHTCQRILLFKVWRRNFLSCIS